MTDQELDEAIIEARAAWLTAFWRDEKRAATGHLLRLDALQAERARRAHLPLRNAG